MGKTAFRFMHMQGDKVIRIGSIGATPDQELCTSYFPIR
jgi:hypothetical protein